MKNNYNEVLSKYACTILLNTKDENNKVLIFTANKNASMEMPILVGVTIDKDNKDIYFVGKKEFLSMKQDFKQIVSAVYPAYDKLTIQELIREQIPKQFSKVVSDCNKDFFKKTKTKGAFKVLPEKDAKEILDTYSIDYSEWEYFRNPVSNETTFEITKPLMGKENWEGNYKVIPKEIQERLMTFPHTIGMKWEGTEFEEIEQNILNGAITHLSLTGETGLGKTTWFEYFVTKYEIPAFEITFDEALDPDNIFGHYTLENGSLKYIPGFLDELIKYPIAIILNEMNRAKPILYSGVISMCDETPYYITRDGSKHPKNPQARIFITCNPADTNPEVNELPAAISSRISSRLLSPLTFEQKVQRLQDIFKNGNEEFSNTAFLEALVETSEVINKELRLNGAEFLIDNRKLKEFVRNILISKQAGVEITEEKFEHELSASFLEGNAANQSQIIPQLREILAHRVGDIYQAFMVAESTQDEEAVYVDVTVFGDDATLNDDLSSFQLNPEDDVEVK